MRVLFDSNVLMNYFTGREDKYSEESKQAVMMCMDGTVEGYIAFHSLSIIWYSSRKYASEETRREWIKLLCDFFTISSAGNREVREVADNTEFSDFEDNLQDICARSINADYIVTVNTKDFESSKVKALTPAELVKVISCS